MYDRTIRPCLHFTSNITLAITISITINTTTTTTSIPCVDNPSRRRKQLTVARLTGSRGGARESQSQSRRRVLQVVYYDWRARRQRPSSAAVITCVVIILICVVYALAVEIAQAARGQGVWDVSGDEMAVLNWLDFLYFLSYVKASVASGG